MNKIILRKINYQKLLIKASLLFIISLQFQSAVAAIHSSESPFIAASTLLMQQIRTEKISINVKNKSLREILIEICRRGKVKYGFHQEVNVDEKKLYSLQLTNVPVEDALKRLFEGTIYDYRIEKDIILVVNRGQNSLQKPNAEAESVSVKGKVIDEQNLSVAGATIIVLGTAIGAITDENGFFSIKTVKGAQLEVSFIGMKNLNYTLNMSHNNLVLNMKKDVYAVDDVIVTGMFNRRAESFTGSASTFKGEDLRRAGNQNVLASLKNIDPSFIVNENIAFGSDPNRMPDIEMRGKTSINLKGEYESNLNQPLFILDGFETTVEKVYDLDMNLVRSITLLKDAAAKAIYGSKSANGVVVIETVQPEAGRLRLSYNATFDVVAPDLSSYNLCNAEQKLRAEVLADKFYSDNPSTQASLTDKYNNLYKEVARGVDSYWLSQPVRTGMGQKHSIYMDGGDEAMRYSANLNYNRVTGTMKGSDRTTVSGLVSLSYRYKSLTFRNNLSVDFNNANNSLYGTFSDYAYMNPYYRIYDDKGALIKDYDAENGGIIYNPLYNATIGGKNSTGYTNIIENFYGEWSVLDNFKVTARVGIDIKNSSAEVFKPASHTDYAQIKPNDATYSSRGSYTKDTGKSANISGDAGVNYSLEKKGHILFANAMFGISQNQTENYGVASIGYPSDKLDYIAAGNSYAQGKPSGMEQKTRQVSVTAALNYSFANRYLADFSWRTNGSSQFGSKERFGQFWAVGLGWNLHNEKFMDNVDFINTFKLRGSIGYTGSQNFNAYQAIPSYSYITDINYNGDIGIKLSSLANENLKWQRQYDRNIGVDMTLWRSIISLRFDYYSNVTTDLLADINTAPSVGFRTYKENMGETLNKGFQIGSQFKVYSDTKRNRYINLTFNALRNTNKVRNISDALKAYNERIDAQKDEFASTKDDLLAFQRDPSIRYEEGQSMTAIWAVRSLGIDPVNGKEVFIRRDGSTTYDWSSADQMVCGDSGPKLNGNVGLSMGWAGFSVNLAFTFRCGGEQYNSTLVNKIENINIKNVNVDSRALAQRWNTPGVPAKFKSIKDITTTKSTSRFVENLNEFVFSSVNVEYDFATIAAIKNSVFRSLRLSFNMSDVGRFSTMMQERGTSYPFARTFSFGLKASF